MSTRTEFAGLQGASWTGYLAALGVLRLLTEAGLSVRMGWGLQAPHVAWLEHPLLEGDDLAARVARELERHLDAFDPFPGRLKLSQVSPDEYREAVDVAAKRGDRLALDLLAAIGSDAAFEPAAAKVDGEKAAKGRKGRTSRKGVEAAGTAKTSEGTDPEVTPQAGGGLLNPPWCVLNGAQQRNLFGIVRRLRELATPPAPASKRGRRAAAEAKAVPLIERVRSVLEGPWRESDEKASLYLDPSSREHAYRWTDPTKDPPRSDGIANLLAFVGLSLLPAVPIDQGGTVVLSSACCAIDNRRTAVSWPIWRGAIGLGGARCLLLTPGLTEKEPPPDFAVRGIATVLRAEIYPIEGAKGAKAYTYPEPIWWV